MIRPEEEGDPYPVEESGPQPKRLSGQAPPMSQEEYLKFHREQA